MLIMQKKIDKEAKLIADIIQRTATYYRKDLFQAVAKELKECGQGHSGEVIELAASHYGVKPRIQKG